VGISTRNRKETSHAARTDRRHRIKGQQLCGPLIASPSALMAFGWLPTLTTLVDPFMRRSLTMHHCFAVVWRRSLELNPCRIKFIKTKE